ncbi:Hsp20/alpha crystallin family protein [Coraliomargarita sp. SDUM461004]|uniref:Hsp20/alpha crystallin family protein n=1 Tax=Thalassobacterium sedimentorum TaxID=3041258 RepID=A0ABU1AHC5_9BACT|nr:Hsp20/alpha crystallin family protein [Coraliomargarita sp. SDUM461004]MDQ8194222.1 Hsp20/alpha crystallin family protein [Coraliomargarita sp. SDUM461004]
MSTQLDTIQKPAKKATERNWQRPHYDVSENEDAFNVRVSLPGVNRDGVDISLEDDTLTVVGTRIQDVPEAWRPLRREIHEGDYRLCLRLNVSVNEANIQAKVENGILELSLPKADEVKPRKIQIS